MFLSVMKRLRNLWLLTLLCFFATGTTWAFQKVGVTSFQFLKVMPGARSTGLGNAYSSVVSGADAMYWNPASLTRVDHLSINLSHVDWFLDTSHNAFAAAYSFGGNLSVGVTAMSVDYGEIPETKVSELRPEGDQYNPGLTGNTFHPGATVIGAGFGQRLTNKFSYGINAKYVNEDMIYRSTSLVMFDGGINYNTGFRTIRLSATLRNFGPEVKYYDKSYPLPQTMNIGISANLVAPGSALFYTSGSQKLLFAFDIVQPRDYDQQYNFGAEYSLWNMLYLRGGYNIHYDTAGLSMGFGLSYSDITFDYSYNQHDQYLGGVNRFTISYQL